MPSSQSALKGSKALAVPGRGLLLAMERQVFNYRQILGLIREVKNAGIAQLDIETVDEKIVIRRILGGPVEPEVINGKGEAGHGDQ